MQLARLLILIFYALVLGTCTPKPEQVIRIGINPWPGYEFLYLAEQKDFFKAEGLNVNIIQYSSLEDVARAFINGQVDGIGSTVVEAVDVAHSRKQEVRVVFATDFSIGGDVIITRNQITELSQLRGQRIGFEFQSVGMYILARALEIGGLAWGDIQPCNTPQLRLGEALAAGELDAVVTYPPFSSKILSNQGMHVLFDSSDLPGEVVDVVTVDARLIEGHPDLPARLGKVWDRTLDYAQSHPDDAYLIMAQREQTTVAEFVASLEGLKLLRSSDQAGVRGQLERAIQLTEATMTRLGVIEPTKNPIVYFHKE